MHRRRMGHQLGMTLTLSCASLACGDDAKQTVDCGMICTAYGQCTNDELDLDDCDNRCVDEVQEDQNLEMDANACAECIGDHKDSCSQIASSCSACEPLFEMLMPENALGSTTQAITRPGPPRRPPRQIY